MSYNWNLPRFYSTRPEERFALTLGIVTGASTLVGAASWLGAHIIKVVNPTIAPNAHFFAWSLAGPCALGIWVLLQNVEKISPISQHALAAFGGYLASGFLTNRIGSYSVSLVAPCVSLFIGASTIALLAIPVLCTAFLLK